MAGYVVRRLPQVRPAPESGVRLAEQERPRLRDVRAEVEQLFRECRGARVFRDDDLVAVREGGGW